MDLKVLYIDLPYSEFSRTTDFCRANNGYILREDTLKILFWANRRFNESLIGDTRVHFLTVIALIVFDLDVQRSFGLAHFLSIL